jgi:hypothetical protein
VATSPKTYDLVVRADDDRMRGNIVDKSASADPLRTG